MEERTKRKLEQKGMNEKRGWWLVVPPFGVGTNGEPGK